MTIAERHARIDEIKSRLVAGPWRYDTHNTIHDSSNRIVCSIPDHPTDGEFTPEQSSERSEWYGQSASNAKFIESTPDDIRFLLDEIDHANKAMDRLHRYLPPGWADD